MSLRTRIALTFLLLLAAVLAAALASVKIANSGNELRAVKQQLENNRLLLRSAAGAVAHDDSFKDAVAARDTDTLVSTLDDSNKRINAALAIVTTLDGHVIAASGLRAAPGSTFPIDALQQSTGEGAPNVMVSNDALYQLIAVQLKMPQPVAWIVMGFELDKNAQRGLDNIDGLGVSVLKRGGAGWQQEVMKGGGWTPSTARQGRSDAEALAQSLADARAPFEGLTNELIVIAVISLIGFAGAAFWIARTITRPLADLTRSVGKVRDGTYDVPAGVARSDEIGVLAEGLQLMSQAVMSRDQSIRRLAYQDALTGLMNRTGFSDRLGETLQLAAGAPIAVAIINLHRFRRINEHLGFSVGDAVLTTTAKRLAAVPSVTAAVARLAADEFAAFHRVDG